MIGIVILLLIIIAILMIIMPRQYLCNTASTLMVILIIGCQAYHRMFSAMDVVLGASKNASDVSIVFHSNSTCVARAVRSDTNINNYITFNATALAPVSGNPSHRSHQFLQHPVSDAHGIPPRLISVVAPPWFSVLCTCLGAR